MRERESEGEKMIESVYMSVRECVCVCMLVPKVSCVLLRVCERETARKKERERGGGERECVCESVRACAHSESLLHFAERERERERERGVCVFVCVM